MAGVAQAYQHLLTIDYLSLSGLSGASPCGVIHWSSDSFHFSNSTVPHSMIKIIDLPYNTHDLLICFYLGKLICNTIEYLRKCTTLFKNMFRQFFCHLQFE